jgi:hypothetical protein
MPNVFTGIEICFSEILNKIDERRELRRDWIEFNLPPKHVSIFHAPPFPRD